MIQNQTPFPNQSIFWGVLKNSTTVACKIRWPFSIFNQQNPATWHEPWTPIWLSQGSYNLITFEHFRYSLGCDTPPNNNGKSNLLGKSKKIRFSRMDLQLEALSGTFKQIRMGVFGTCFLKSSFFEINRGQKIGMLRSQGKDASH